MEHTGIRLRWVVLSTALFLGSWLWSQEAGLALRRVSGGIGALHLEGFGHEKALHLLAWMGGDGRAYYLRSAYPLFALCAVLGGVCALVATAYFCRCVPASLRARVMRLPLLAFGMNVIRHGCVIAMLLLYSGGNRALGVAGEIANLLYWLLLSANVLAVLLVAAKQANRPAR